MNRTISAMIAAMGISALLLFSTDAPGQDGCAGGKLHVIQVSPDGDGNPTLFMPGASAEELHVCNGDQVQWVLKGSDRDFLVEFISSAPFPDGTSRGSSGGAILVTIDAEPGTYDYDISFAGDEPMDPRIIVDP